MELLAQVVEEVSVVASGKQRKKPRQVPRPEHMTHPAAPPPGDGKVVSMDGYRKAIGVLAATRQPTRG